MDAIRISIKFRPMVRGQFRQSQSLVSYRTRLQVYDCNLGIETIYKICPLDSLPLLVLSRRGDPYIADAQRPFKKPPDMVPVCCDTPLSILGINRQMNEEIRLSYVIYFGRCFTYLQRWRSESFEDSQELQNILTNLEPDILQFNSRIGFTIN